MFMHIASYMCLKPQQKNLNKWNQKQTYMSLAIKQVAINLLIGITKKLFISY